MSTLPLLYSSRSLQKQPKKQGGIFSLTLNKSMATKSMHMSPHQKETNGFISANQLINNNITNYYFSKTARNSSHNSTKTHRYAKSNFGNKLSQTTMVQPDALFTQVSGSGQQIESVGTLFANINTSLILAITFLNNDKMQLENLNNNIQDIKKKFNKQIDDLDKDFKDRISKLSKNLSKWRRQTLMQVKVNHAQIEKIKQDSQTTSLVMNKIQQKVSILKEECSL